MLSQISTNVLKTQTTVLRTALTLLEVTSVSVMMDILWTLINTHAMVVIVDFMHNYFLLRHTVPINFTDNDECVSGMNMCHTNASCTNTNGSYECQCLPGFTGDGFNCSSKKENSHICFKNISLFPPTDIDECSYSSLNNCSENANCTDTIGSYECMCTDGYTGDGRVCDGLWKLYFCTGINCT